MCVNVCAYTWFPSGARPRYVYIYRLCVCVCADGIQWAVRSSFNKHMSPPSGLLYRWPEYFCGVEKQTLNFEYEFFKRKDFISSLTGRTNKV